MYSFYEIKFQPFLNTLIWPGIMTAVKFINREPHWYSESRRVNEAIHIRFQPNNINRNSWSGIEIPAYNQTA